MKETIKRFKKALDEANDMIEYHGKRIKSYEDEASDLRETINKLENVK